MKIKHNSAGPSGRRTKWNRQAILKRAKEGRAAYRMHMLGIVVCLFMGTWFSTIIVNRVAPQWRSTGFVDAHGKVTESRLKESTSGKSKTTRASIGIVYNVGIEAEIYVGVFTSGGLGDNHARWMSRSFPVGSSIIVYYNPDNPAEFVLQRGMRGVDVYWLMLIPAGFASILVWLIAVLTHGRRVAKLRARLRRGARRRRTIHWINAIQSGIVVYVGATLILVISYFAWTEAADISIAVARRNWIGVLLLSLGIFAWKGIPRYLSGGWNHKRKPRKPRPSRKPRINSSSDRAAPGSA